MMVEDDRFELEITGDVDGNPTDGITVDLTKNAVYKNARGGSELMLEGLLKRLPKEHLDSFNFIMSRVRDKFFDDRPTILWLQDLPQDPESMHLKDESSRERFTKIVFNSYWQQDKYARYLGIPYDEGVVLKNAVESLAPHEKPKDGKIKLIYFSTPHRGLNVLEAAVRGLSQHRDDFELDVYSSFEIYGWKERDVEFKELFDRLNDLDCVNYHGSVSNDKIREALTKSHILAYPSIYEESSCCVAIEAMAAGCMAVVPNYGALTETCTDFAWMYNWEPDQSAHAQKYAAILNHAIDSFWDPSVQSVLRMQVSYYNYFYGWDMRLNEWNDMLNSIKVN